MKEIHSAQCVFQGDGIIAVCYLDDLHLFAMTKEKTGHLKSKLKRDLIMMSPEKRKSFLGIKLSWREDAIYPRQKGSIEWLLEDDKVDN